MSAAETKTKKRYIFLSIVLLHFVLTGILLHGVAAGVVGLLYRGEPVQPRAAFLFALWKILSFPVVTLYLRFVAVPLHGLLIWAPYAINSLLWAGCIVGLALLLNKFLMSRRAAGQAHS